MTFQESSEGRVRVEKPLSMGQPVSISLGLWLWSCTQHSGVVGLGTGHQQSVRRLVSGAEGILDAASRGLAFHRNAWQCTMKNRGDGFVFI